MVVRSRVVARESPDQERAVVAPGRVVHPAPQKESPVRRGAAAALGHASVPEVARSRVPARESPVRRGAVVGPVVGLGRANMAGKSAIREDAERES